MTRTAESPTIVIQSRKEAADGMVREPAATIYFDGSCPLCSAEIGHYKSLEGSDRLEFVDISADGSDPGPDLDREDALGRFHIRQPDGTLLTGARAFVEIWAILPHYRWAAELARVPGVTWALEGAYRLFLPIRPFLSRIAARFGARAVNPRTCER